MSRQFSDGGTGALRSTGNPGLPIPWIWTGWFNPASPSGAEQTILARQNALSPSEKYARLYHDASGILKYQRLNFPASESCSATISLTADTWYHFCVYDDGQNRAIWVNGANKGTGSGVITEPTMNHTVIGALEQDTVPTFSSYFDGSVAELALFNNYDGVDLVWSIDDTERMALSMYQSRIRGGKLWRPNACMHIPLLRDEDRALSMPNSNTPLTFIVFDTVTIGEHPRIVDLSVDGAIIRRKGGLERRAERHYPRGDLRGVSRGSLIT